MALEQLEIHSKSYLVRWVKISAGHTISWSIQPHKKSLKFGIFKHPSGGSDTPTLPASSTFDGPPTPGVSSVNTTFSSKTASSRNDPINAAEKLLSIGLQSITPIQKCEADKVSRGTYDVPVNQGGMYGLVFDNTFSKQMSKTATFVLLTYPTGSAPQSTHHLHHLQNSATTSQSSIGIHPSSPRVAAPVSVASTESLHSNGANHASVAKPPRPASSPRAEAIVLTSTGFYTGILYKRRRKRHQGFARRFFSLDFTSSTLSYYHNRRSSALRGAIPLSLAVVGMNENRREISVDSGAEVWHLRAGSKRDFDGWRDAFEKASKTSAGPALTTPTTQLNTSAAVPARVQFAEDQDWAKIEILVGRVAGIRDAVRRLAATTDQSGSHSDAGQGSAPSSVGSSPVNVNATDYFQEKERRPFWRRASSSASRVPTVFKRSMSTQLAVPIPAVSGTSPTRSGASSQHGRDEPAIHEHCMALLNDLDAVVAEFTATIQDCKRRRLPLPDLHAAVSRQSMDSTNTDDFFDAEPGTGDDSAVVVIPDGDGEHQFTEADEFTDAESDSNSEFGSPDSFDHASTAAGADGSKTVQNALFPAKPKILTPLPLDRVRRRTTVPASTTAPPSLIGFLRKNVGKDLSTISMPVSANEPTSLLQRIAEHLEYTALLDAAARCPPSSPDRLLHIAAFAVSSFANCRAKERSIRKPFNPLLGETFELVREDQGFRFVAEKVSHRPVRIACQAESSLWNFTQSPMPTQKFWGKSAELNTDGRARIVLHRSGSSAGEAPECFSWAAATCFLRNIIAGEKYVEPVGSMTVVDETTGAKAVVTFKTKGMFSGRSEEIAVQAFSAEGVELPLGLQGKWTSALTLTNNSKPVREIWSVGSLVENPSARYGLTTFAASLNEVTAIEKGRLPPTDSRLRPDQRAAENGDLDRAETIKGQLEEAQRLRKAKRDEEGSEYTPRWFERVDARAGKGVGGDVASAPASAEAGHENAEEVWRMKAGKGDGYWEVRERGAWGEAGVGGELFTGV